MVQPGTPPAMEAPASLMLAALAARGLFEESLSVPLQVLPVTPSASTRLAGSASLKPRPDWAGLPALLLMVKVSTDGCPAPTSTGLNALASCGGGLTVRATPPPGMPLVIPADRPLRLAGR